MSALLYVLSHDMKNKLFDLRRKPGRLIMYLVIIALLLFVVISSTTQTYSEATHTDIMWLKAILIALFLLTVIPSIKQGLSKGSTIFGMEDVNLLFVAPINPRAILLFGVVRLMKSAALSSIFILFNSSTLRTFFGVRFGGMMIIFASFILVTAVSQVLSLVIYSLTNSRPRRQKIVKYIAVIAFAPVVAGLLWQIWVADFDFVAGLLQFVNSHISSYTPIVGWAAAGSLAFIAGEYAAGAFFFGLLAAAGAILVAVIYIGNPDYYEDVLVATETAFQKARDVAEGNIDAATMSDKQIKVKGTGVGGFGASALFFRHMRESFRVNKFGLWGPSTLAILAFAVIYAFITSRVNYDVSGNMLTTLIMLMIAQIFLIGTGRGVKDTYSHYIYMIPERPFSKLIWSNLEVLLKVLVQNALAFTAAGLIMGIGVEYIIISIITCTFFSFVILGVSFLSMRFTGAHMSMGILSMLYILAIIIIMMPGIVASIIIGSAIGNGGMLIGILILAAWEVIAGIGCFVASKGVLHNCDMPSLNQLRQK